MITLPPNWPDRERAQRRLERYLSRPARQQQRQEVSTGGRVGEADPQGPPAVGDGRAPAGPEGQPSRRGGQATPAIVLALGVRAAARAVGVHPSTISREIAAGRLKARRLGRRVLIRPADLRAWLESLPEAKGGRERAS